MLLGYAYCIPALWAIPSAPLEAEDHLLVTVGHFQPIVVFNPCSTDRHSLTIPQLVDISIPSAIPFDCAPCFVVLPNIVCLGVGARVPFCSSTTTRTSSIHSITPGFFLPFTDHLIPALPLHQHQLERSRSIVRCMQTCVFVYHRPRSNGYACTDVGERSLIGHDSPVASPFAHMNGDWISL